MDPATRVRWLQGQIASHKQVKETCESHGDEVGAKREERKIKELERQINKLI
ncbi:hypothetical protein SEA_SHAM_9 [Streptomyces phage Sham]|nr:hypothetical protein SEA_SHAM_9 [Streptomyces phage Sham]